MPRLVTAEDLALIAVGGAAIMVKRSAETKSLALTIAVTTVVAYVFLTVVLRVQSRSVRGRAEWQDANGNWMPGAEPWYHVWKYFANDPRPDHVKFPGGSTFMVKGVAARPAAVITDPAEIQQHFRDQTKAHTKDSGFGLGWLSTKVLGESVGAKFGDDWLRIRKPMSTGFTSARVQAHVPMLTEESQKWVDLVGPTGEFLLSDIWPKSSLANYGFVVVSKIIYGADLPDDDYRELVALKDMLFDADHGLFPLMASGNRVHEFLPTKLNRSLKDFLARWTALNRRYVAKCQDKAHTDGRDDLFSVIAAMMRDGDIHMSEREFFDTVDEMLTANCEVSAAVLSWAVVHVASSPQAQDKIAAELDEVLGGRPVQTFDELNQLTYLDWAVKESARLRPPAEYNLPELTPADEVLGGFLVPKGTPVLLNLFNLNWNPEYWPDPQAFRPERFEPDADGLPRYNPAAFFRFGMGPRKCIGYRYADALTKTLLAALLQNYRVSIDGDVQIFRKGVFEGPNCRMVLERRR